MTTTNARRGFAGLPLVGFIARDSNVIFYILVIALTALVLAVKTWGLVALALVPVVFILLLLITRG
ncbi:MAG: hypothetical protein U1D66_13530 [Erythrobacter sp.]|nr:hypothetical protein [Erythrobacter sp.]